MVMNSPSTQKSSMYVLTFDELQNMFGENGKDSKSMDMDEFLDNIWTCDETQKNSDCVENIGNLPQEEQSSLGEMTLEVFLGKTEAILEDNQVVPNRRLFGDQSNSLFEEEDLTETKNDVKRQKFLPKQAAISLTSSSCLVQNNPQMGSPDCISDGLSYVFPSSYFDSSPACYAHGECGVNERKSSAILEGVIERRMKRMIKNRESAARSRARKQSYTVNLEAEVAKLKELNHELQEEIMESLKNIQVTEKMKLGSRGVSLRRTLTGPW